MKKFFRENGILLLIAAVLLTAVAAVGSLLLGGSADPISNAVRVITTPVRAGSNAVMNWAEHVTGYLTEYDELKARVAELEKENADLKAQIRDAVDANEENARYRELLELSEKHRDFTFAACHVTEYSASGWESTITLSKGSTAGIQAQDCVITETGALVGVVTEVGLNWCTVATVVDLSTEIGAAISRTDSAGVLEGDFTLMQQERVKLDYLPSDTEFRVGDEVLTSGRGGVYPAGLVIGSVEELLTEESGMSRYAVVCPAADLDSLSQVFVITDFSISD